MKFLRVYLLNQTNLSIGATRDQETNEFIPVEKSSIASKRQNELVYYCPEKQTVARIYTDSGILKREIYHMTTIPGDGFQVNFFNLEQKEVTLAEILKCKTISEIIEHEKTYDELTWAP